MSLMDPTPSSLFADNRKSSICKLTVPTGDGVKVQGVLTHLSPRTQPISKTVSDGQPQPVHRVFDDGFQHDHTTSSDPSDLFQYNSRFLAMMQYVREENCVGIIVVEWQVPAIIAY